MNIENIKKLVEFDTPTVANGLAMLEVQDPSAGYTGPDIRALMPELGVKVGIAVTARLDTTSPGTDKPESLFTDWLRLIQEAAKGDDTGAMPVFTVIESVGLRPRYTVTIGDGMGTMMKMAGAVGFLTNGCIRDIEGVRQVPLACWGAGLSPMHGRMRWLDLNNPVVIDGMTVRPGDFVHADANGAIVIPSQVADQVYDKAMEVHIQEQAMFAKLREPGMTLDAYLSS
ncbi:RraA family protein [bacterium]|nr:RraA family protein [bacterium]